MQQIRGLVVSAMVSLGACTSLDDGEELERYEDEQAEIEQGRQIVAPGGPAASDGGGRTGGDWIVNGLGDPSVSGVNPAFALGSPQGLSTEGWLEEEDSEGVDAIRYMVECALNAGDSVTVEDEEELSYTFDGLLGLAPEWKTGPCDQDCREWVSACLMARTNAAGTETLIFVQGDHPAIGFGVDPAFPYHEGTFFGDVFDPSEIKHACQGSVMGRNSAAAQGRTCTIDSAECGFTIHQDCVVDAGCDMGPTGVATIDCQPDPAGPIYHGISVHVMDVL